MKILTRAFLLVACVATSALATAQTVTVSLRAQTPITVATTGVAPMTQTVPAGPLPTSGVISASSPTSGFAAMSWFSVEGSTLASVQLIHELLGEAAGGPHDVLVELTASAPTPVYLEVEQVFQGTPGGTVPTTWVDVGDDGTNDLGFASDYSVRFGSYTLGAQPLLVRVRYEGATDITSSALTSTIVRAVPRNQVFVTQTALGCFQTSVVQQSFDGTGIAVSGFAPPANAPSVLIVGFAPQPVLLPPLGGPCLLYPQLDVLLPFWNVTTIEIPLPAAVRPAELYLQRAMLLGGQIAVDDAFRVQAQ